MLREIEGGEEKGTTEDEVVGWHHRLNGEFEQVPGDGEGQGSLACCSPWGNRQSDPIERLHDHTGLEPCSLAEPETRPGNPRAAGPPAGFQQRQDQQRLLV